MTSPLTTVKTSPDNGSGDGKAPVGAALVVGAGIAGMQAALDLAESGIRVYLLDRAPAVVGTALRLARLISRMSSTAAFHSARRFINSTHRPFPMLSPSKRPAWRLAG